MRNAARLAIYVGVLALGLEQTFSPTFLSGFARMQTDRGDSMLNHYLLEHSWQCLSNPNYCGSLFSPPFFLPERYTLWYSEHFLGVAPAYWSLRLILPYDLAYQVWQMLMAALNFAAFAVAIRWLGTPDSLAILGAYLWAFAIAHIYQTRHQQMIPRFWMPFAAYYGWSFASAPSARSLNRLLGCVFMQCIACMNTAWFLVAALGTFLVLAVASRPGALAEVANLARSNGKRVACVVGGWGTAMLLAFVPYVIVNWGMNRSYRACLGYIPTPGGWFSGPPGSPWQRTLAPYLGPVGEECHIFLGFGFYGWILVASAYLLIVRTKDRSNELRFAAASLATAAIWALIASTPYNGGPSLWQFVRLLPGGEAIRCVSRVFVAVQLFALLGTIAWLNAAAAGWQPRLRAVLFAAILVALIPEQLGYEPESFEKVDFYPIADRLAERVRGADGTYVVPTYTDAEGKMLEGAHGEVMGMWAGMRANVPVVNGWSGRWPPGNHPHGYAASEADLREWLGGRFRGKLAIVDPDRPDDDFTIQID